MNTIRKYPALVLGFVMACLTGGLAIATAAGVPPELSVAIGGTLAGINVAAGALVHAAVTPNSAVAMTTADAAALKAALPPLPTNPTTTGV